MGTLQVLVQYVMRIALPPPLLLFLNCSKPSPLAVCIMQTVRVTLAQITADSVCDSAVQRIQRSIVQSYPVALRECDAR